MSNKNESIGVLATKAILGRTVFLIITATIMFLAAGTFKWINAWIYLSLFYTVMILIVFMHLASNPENVKLHQNADNTNKLDKLLITLYNLMLFIFPATAGLLFRAQMGFMDSWPWLGGLIIMALATAIALWSIRVNQFFEVEIRIQGTEHHVVNKGPYKVVRHPGYLSSIMMWFATPFILQNNYLFIFSILFSLVFVVRTNTEDKQLKKGLPGYVSYSETVRFRLIPGIW